jgi:hypothetical protein
MRRGLIEVTLGGHIHDEDGAGGGAVFTLLT